MPISAVLRSKRPGALAGYVTAVALVGGLAGGIYLMGHPPGSGTPARVLVGAHGAAVVATSPVDSAMEASASGTVGVVGGCLGIVDGTGMVVSWPRGSRPLEDRVGVRLPTGRTIEAGEVIDFAGGDQEADAATREACAGTTSVFMFGYLSHPDARS
ncbi:hypothetical protein WDV85_07965 [Pseudokineococcus sp. 5B2Z-1]|uniref:hypothetical protein n=1 Tax=Pseudokineococcus sp. 5B2Z-1 TaxID=3132744 RepID=UPI00309CA25A